MFKLKITFEPQHVKPLHLDIAQIEKSRSLALPQRCNRHAICANMNESSKQAKRRK